MASRCKACKAEMPDGPYKNCSACRAVWRESARFQRAGPLSKLRGALASIERRSTEPDVRAIARKALAETD